MADTKKTKGKRPPLTASDKTDWSKFDVNKFYEALAKILGNKYGVEIVGKVVPRKPEDGDALFTFAPGARSTDKAKAPSKEKKNDSDL